MARSFTDVVAQAAHRLRPAHLLWSLHRSTDGSTLTYGDPDQPFFIASATKLYVTAILAQMRSEGLLSWDAPIADLLDQLPLRPLVGDATVREVMGHTAGLGDYFEGKRRAAPSTFAQVVTGDFGWDVHDVLAWTAEVPHGVRGRGLYSDTGYQLLGAVIEKLDHHSFADSVRMRIAEPLDLRHTYVFDHSSLGDYERISPLFSGDVRLHIPQAMASVQADGGIVSTINEGLVFLDAFFNGRLFPAELMPEIAGGWHAIFRPLEYGTGIMRFALPRVMTGMRRIPPFIGHSGASGTVMFTCPELGLTVVGTVNQIRNRSLPYRLMVRTALTAS